jgi:hypothetical protein
MTAQEREIYYYLKARRHDFVPLREISRRTGSKRRFRATPDWARSILASMSERSILEGDPERGYRLKPMPKKETKGKRWAAPEIAKVLKASGKAFDNVVTVDDEDEYYDNL